MKYLKFKTGQRIFPIRGKMKNILMSENIFKIFILRSDFPQLDKMRQQLEKYDFSKFHSADQKMMEKVDKMLATDIPKLMNLIPHEDREMTVDGKTKVVGGVFAQDIMPGQIYLPAYRQ